MLRIDPLIIHYPVRIREVTIGVILFLTITFYFFPRFLGEGQKTNFSFVEALNGYAIPGNQSSDNIGNLP